jgi:hypothetical protein
LVQILVQLTGSCNLFLSFRSTYRTLPSISYHAAGQRHSSQRLTRR